MKKLIAMLLAVCLLFSAVPAVLATEAEETAAATAAPVRAADQCGEDLYWKYEDGTLTVSGSGAMDDYSEAEAPWADYAKEIEKLVLSGVTYIGADAFRNFDRLTEITFGEGFREFGAGAFYGCDGLTVLYLPQSFKIFGEACFLGCENLKDIHCQGSFPSFRQNCLWDCWLTIHYPAERPWSVSLIRELEEAFRGRIEFRASDGTDPYVPTEVTEATEVTEPVQTAAPTEVPVPETQPPTEAATEAPTQVPTEAATQAPTQPQPTEAVETEPEDQAEALDLGGMLKMALAGMATAIVLTVVLALVLILRGRKRGKYED